MTKTTEIVTHVCTLQKMERQTRVTSVFEQEQVIYAYRDRIEINHMMGRKMVFRNAKGQVIAIHPAYEGRATTMKDIMAKIKAEVDGTADRWRFERSSGYAGYRCMTCRTWVYADAPRKCDCDTGTE